MAHFDDPVEIHFDQGLNIKSKMVQEACTALGINRTRTTPLHPQSDGYVERFNQTKDCMLSRYDMMSYCSIVNELPLLDVQLADLD